MEDADKHDDDDGALILLLETLGLNNPLLVAIKIWTSLNNLGIVREKKKIEFVQIIYKLDLQREGGGR